MDRIIAPNSVPSSGADAAPATGTPQYATSGNPGSGVPATVFPAYQYNAIQEEILAVIAKAGITFDRTNNAQLLEAISIIYRTRLTAPLNLYVATTGSDTLNNGLTSGSPFATIQKALNLVYNNFDTNGFNVTVNLAAGTYTAPAIASGPTIGQNAEGGSVTILGNAASPSSVIISVASANAVTAANGALLYVNGVTLLATGTGLIGWALAAYNAGQIGFQNVVFGACGSGHMWATVSGVIIGTGPYSITGSAPSHILVEANSIVSILNTTITLVGSPGFANGFAMATMLGYCQIYGNTFSGSGGGYCYQVTTNGVINTNGGGATYLPGSTGGIATTGGQYV